MARFYNGLNEVAAQSLEISDAESVRSELVDPCKSSQSQLLRSVMLYAKQLYLMRHDDNLHRNGCILSKHFI